MDHEPVWSPNGTKIAYSSQRNVVTIPASGGTPINVENDATLFSREPDWSPDGTKIAFTGTMGAPQDDDIYTVPASGGTPINLTGSLDSGPPGPDPNDNEQAPAWSPNGTKIVYQDETETIFDEDQFINSFTLTVIPASGGTPTQVTKDPNLEGMQDRFPDWQAIDRTPPKVTSTNPVNTATGVAAGANVIATFSEAMKASTINITTFNLKKSGTSTVLSATVNYNATTKQATLNPSANLQSGATYVATVTTGAKDLAGNSLDQNPITAGNQAKTWSFRVG
jgi:dipeptidyl aminopeptidase/acylaminoacyl peptidase